MTTEIETKLKATGDPAVASSDLLAPEAKDRHELFGLWVMRINRALGCKEWKKQLRIGRLEIQAHWRAKSNLWGRFGGGWNWKLGFQAGGNTVIVSLLIMDVRFYYRANDQSHL